MSQELSGDVAYGLLCPFDKKPCIGRDCKIFDNHDAGPHNHDCSINIIKDLLISRRYR